MTSLISPLLALWRSLTGSANGRVQPIRPIPEVLDGAYRLGFSTVIPNHPGKVGLRVVDAGQLKVTSGRIVACDAFLLEGKAFDFLVRPGAYPVRLAIADLGNDHFRVALARVDFLNTAATRWELALTPGQALSDLKPGQIFGYGVDSGTGAFGDAEAIARLDRSRGDSDAWIDEWIAAGEAGGKALGLPYVFLLMLDAGPDNNVALFSSGWGDGFYTSWVGYDADGKVTALVTDFAVITAVTGV
ncbi:MAG: DUF4241 domain-containing protein [Asticcacaulis sp.]|nr:DUF4241 domain-containing protein [Asticcacaulis sp.]